jgi:hypothetical protein
METVRNLLTGSAIAAAAMAIVVAAAQPAPSSVAQGVVGVGEPSSFAGRASGEPTTSALPACPKAVVPGQVSAFARPGAAALAFVAAWGRSDQLTMNVLADPIFRVRAAALATTGGGPGADVHMQRVGSLGHDPLAAPIAHRCGPQALTLMRIVTLTAPGYTPLHVYLVRRQLGYRVWALR